MPQRSPASWIAVVQDLSQIGAAGIEVPAFGCWQTNLNAAEGVLRPVGRGGSHPHSGGDTREQRHATSAVVDLPDGKVKCKQ
jgi:hypothetical protein